MAVAFSAREAIATIEEPSPDARVLVDGDLDSLEASGEAIDLIPESDESPGPVKAPRKRAVPTLPRRSAPVPTAAPQNAPVEARVAEAAGGDQEPEFTEIEPPAEAAEPIGTPSRAPRPPPPRLKRQPTGEVPAELPPEQARRRLRSPWWEEMFSEDFARADRSPAESEIAKEVNFIEAALGLKSGGIVLDLGCGSGHHSVELAARGYGVVGFDLSVFQLALAGELAQECGQRINFLQGDMREMAFDETFDGVLCWNTTFGYFEEDKNFAVAQRIFRALRPGGMLLLDVLNRDYVTAHEPSQTWFDGDACVCMDDPYVDYITSRLRIKRSLIFDDGRTRECIYSLRLYSLHELGKLLHDVGFRVCQASGHPTTPGAFFGPYSPRIIMLAQRP